MRNMLRYESGHAGIASQVVGGLLGDFSRSAASIRADRGWVPPGFHLGSTSAARFSGSLKRAGRRHDLGPIENKSEYLGASVGARNGSRTSAKHLTRPVPPWDVLRLSSRGGGGGGGVAYGREALNMP